MSFKKSMVVLGIIFLVSLGLCGISVSSNGTGVADTLIVLSSSGMAVSGFLLLVVFLVWMVREIYRAFRGRND